MKINDDLQQILALQNTDTNKKTNTDLPKTSAEFADLFSQALDKETAASSNTTLTKNLFQGTDTDYQELSAVNYATMNKVILEESEDGVDNNALEQEIYSITAMLDGLDSYAEKLSQSNSNKAAWEDLQKISGQLASLKQHNNLPQGLNAIVDEIDVLRATEQFKMNRGDYQI